jgi:hypothetical protein
MEDVSGLKIAAAKHGGRARWSARAIVGGLCFETIVLLAYSADKSWLETGLLIVANLIIAAAYGQRTISPTKPMPSM